MFNTRKFEGISLNFLRDRPCPKNWEPRLTALAGRTNVWPAATQARGRLTNARAEWSEDAD